jgi:hypothetical protein
MSPTINSLFKVKLNQDQVYMEMNILLRLCTVFSLLGLALLGELEARALFA